MADVVTLEVTTPKGLVLHTEAEHVHSSSDKYFQQFEELMMRLGMDGNYC